MSEEAEAMLLRRAWLVLAALSVAGAGGIVMVACATGSVTGGGGIGDDGTGDATAGDGSGNGDGGHGGKCDANLSTDPHNCGSCGNSCTGGQLCSLGKCGAQCMAPTLKCGDAGCVDITKDPDNCGNCGNVCLAPEGGAPPPPDGGGGNDPGQRMATPTCTSMTCGYACPQGSAQCGDAGCWDTTVAHDHCGTCDNACAANQVCTQSQCCPQGDMLCNGVCTDVTTDNSNCGACGKACTATGQTCMGGACACPAGQMVCNNACTDTQTDTNNCGACGKVCSATGETCMGGACACPAGQMVCNNACTDTQTDPNDCGSCGHVCPAQTPTCLAGQCVGCGANDVSYQGHCYYLDGSQGACDPGYKLWSQSILTNIASMFAGLNYKHTVSGNCCIDNADGVQNWGMVTHCNSNGPFSAGEPAPGGAGCSGVMENFPNQLTLCGK